MVTHVTDILTTLITNVYISTGLLGIVVAMALESCCIPLPSEIVIPLAGIMLASGKMLSGMSLLAGLLLVAAAGSIGCLLGSIVAYAIGSRGGRPFLLKYGRHVLISRHDADRAEAFFQRWGSATAFFSRLLPVVRSYISLPAGIAKMPFAEFCISTFLVSFLWCLLLAYIGSVLGVHLGTLSAYFRTFDSVILVVVVVLVALYIWRHIRNDRIARDAPVTDQAINAHTLPVPPQPSGQPPQGWKQWSQARQPYPPAAPPVSQSPPAPSQSPQQQGWNQPQRKRQNSEEDLI